MEPLHKKLWQLGHSVPMFLEIYARFVEEFGKADFSMYESEEPRRKVE